ncbi:MAG: SAM-dependent methyltransferase [Rhodopirellula sp.]|nr:SAM-dependent methyltransferase [Rhodopirellula sp.]
MDQAVRNRLRNVVTQCRRLLEHATAQALQGRFGIYATGRKDDVHVEDDSRMGHLTDEDRALRRDLLDHLEHIKAVGLKPREALEQLVREIAFTHLNRLCAYKMMEARGLIREAVSRGLKSQGFFFYLADHPEDEKLQKGGQQDAAYRNFLDSLGGTLSEEIGVLFNPNDPANRLYPPQRVLDEVLGLINGDDLAGIWTGDETIGWVYQYFNPKELKDAVKRQTKVPRNSYEIALRSSYYTPRFVVQFLTDNILARIWYEMRKGETSLKDRCRYLVRRPTEVFLDEGQEPPDNAKETRDDLSQEELLKQPVYVPHRPKKDPREIGILDPACGSGHFLLYCFDLLQVIYEEAYDDPDLGAALRRDYPSLPDLRRAMPGLILKHNVHGIDIDMRATQIAALALWLRCQRAYQELGLKNSGRPKITRSNIVCAEPMPGETDLLKEFTATLQPRMLGQLVETIFEKMKLAGEAGSLLKIEEEIRQAAQSAKAEFIEWKKHQEKARGHLFPEMVKREQPNLLDFADLTDEVFLDRVEEEIVEALRRYATQAENGRGFRRRLFADDAGQGFAFIDLCRKRYDAVLMNPPYTETDGDLQAFLKRCYPANWTNVYSAFIERGLSLGRVRVGIVCPDGFLSAYRMRNLRSEFVERRRLEELSSLGKDVFDEMGLATVAMALNCKSSTLPPVLVDVNEGGTGRVSYIDRAVVNARTNYILTSDLIRGGSVGWNEKPLSPTYGLVTQGNRTFDDFRFVRAWWEVPPVGTGTSAVSGCMVSRFR